MNAMNSNTTAIQFDRNEAGTLFIDEILETAYDLENNEKFKAIFEGFENVAADKIRLYESERIEFVSAFVVGEAVFTLTRASIDDGCCDELHLHKVAVSSCIHSGAWRYCQIDERFNLIHLGERKFKNCKENRQIAADKGYAIAS